MGDQALHSVCVSHSFARLFKRHLLLSGRFMQAQSHPQGRTGVGKLRMSPFPVLIVLYTGQKQVGAGRFFHAHLIMMGGLYF